MKVGDKFKVEYDNWRVFNIEVISVNNNPSESDFKYRLAQTSIMTKNINWDSSPDTFIEVGEDWFVMNPKRKITPIFLSDF